MAKNRIAARIPQLKQNVKGDKSSNSNFFVKSTPKNKRSFSKSFDKADTTASDDVQSIHPKRRKLQESDSSHQETDSKPTKKPFDKKTYRLKKYSNKYKVQQWEDNRKKAVLKDFYRQVKDPEKEFDVTKIYDDPRNRNSDDDDVEVKPTITSIKNIENTSEDIVKKKKPYQKAQAEFRRIKEEKQKKREEFLKAKAEKEEALKKYRKEKSIKFKRLSRKTKKGQPIMKDRIEMLLEKIQKSID